jgi:hypothetical protein
MQTKPILISLAAVLFLCTAPFGEDIGSWTSADIFGGQIWSIAIKPDDHKVLFAGGIQTLYKSTDGAATWQETTLKGLIPAIAISPVNTNIVYVCASGSSMIGISKSLDCGATWTQLATPAGFEKIVCDPADVNVVYASDRQTSLAHLYKSTDGGIYVAVGLYYFTHCHRRRARYFHITTKL